MIKKNMLTAAGIILSFVIAVGGWVTASWLIEMESYRLLSGVSSFVVDIPTMEAPYMNEENGYQNIQVGLTDGEIVSILRNWELTENRRPHEPAPGQIDMETAIISGRTGILFLQEHNILPAELTTFNNTGAFLSQNVPQGGEFLPLRYSYWTVTFNSDDITVRMTINAVTGQVWWIEIAGNPGYVVTSYELSVAHDDILNMLATFTSGLGIHTSQMPVTVWKTGERHLERELRRINPWDAIIAYQDFADGNAAVVVDTTGGFVFEVFSETDESVLFPDRVLHFIRLNIYLTV